MSGVDPWPKPVPVNDSVGFIQSIVVLGLFAIKRGRPSCITGIEGAPTSSGWLIKNLLLPPETRVGWLVVVVVVTTFGVLIGSNGRFGRIAFWYPVWSRLGFFVIGTIWVPPNPVAYSVSPELFIANLLARAKLISHINEKCYYPLGLSLLQNGTSSKMLLCQDQYPRFFFHYQMFHQLLFLNQEFRQFSHS